MNIGFGMRTSQRLELVEISIVPKVDEPAKQEGRVVLEMTVTEGPCHRIGLESNPDASRICLTCDAHHHAYVCPPRPMIGSFLDKQTC